MTTSSLTSLVSSVFSHQLVHGDQVTPFEVFAGSSRGDAAFLLQAEPGAMLPIARRNGEVITGQVRSHTRGLSDYIYFEGNRIKAHEFEIEIQENTTAGLLHFFMTPSEMVLFEIDTKNQDEDAPMAAGAGTILMTWLATQAVLRGGLFAVTGIQNVQVVEILRKRRLITPKTGSVELIYSDKIDQYMRIRRFPLESAMALEPYRKTKLEYPHKFLVAQGTPNPTLTERLSLLS